MSNCPNCGGPMVQRLHSPTIGEECLNCVGTTAEVFGNKPIEKAAIDVGAAIREMIFAGGHHVDVAMALVEFAKHIKATGGEDET